jgi:hypothetical protein
MASAGESSEGSVPSWPAWARELQALAQTGLTFTTGHYDILLYRRPIEGAAEITAAHTGGLPVELTPDFLKQPGYATPKVDVRGAMVRDGRLQTGRCAKGMNHAEKKMNPEGRDR